ncbi:PREDICTED: uncharacterized protein LOC108364724 [Rhagoletis zephyria]|uniref:uncharacterized protein LOC108364724 n=1 Tax=Rhagoletis zephyria TaxID=28612 RepID=UPI00081152A8|nr:PREDICTED: uncharacterized protein LOC108364724 [Rhagoletis zephyria]
MNSTSKKVFSLRLDGAEVQQVRNIKWLGRTISSNASISPHVDRVKSAASSSRNLIKILTTIKGGLEPRVAINFYKAFVRSKVEFANTTYANAPRGFNKRLQGISNDTLRRCLGLPPSSPIHARYALAGELPPLKRAEWLTAKELGKQWIVNEELRKDLVSEYPVKSSYSFVYSKFKNIFNKINVNVSFCRHANFSVEFSSLVKSKREFSKEQLTSIFRCKFDEFAKEGCYMLATDASVVNDVAGIAFYDPQEKMYKMFKLEGNFSSTFGELVAIRQAVCFLIKQNIDKWVIITDSLAAVQLLGRRVSTNFIVASIHNMIANSNCISAKLVWVPSHVGIGVNERADEYAKAAVSERLTINVDLTLGEALCKNFK